MSLHAHLVPYFTHYRHSYHTPQFYDIFTTDSVVRAKAQTYDGSLEEWNWCAMCCVSTLIKTYGHGNPIVKDLFREARKYGVYKAHPDYGTWSRAQRKKTPQWTGAWHKELAQFINKKTGLLATPFRGATSDESLVGLLDADCALLLSVGSDIGYNEWNQTGKTSGHLILVFGYLYEKEIVDGVEERRVKHLIYSNSTGLINPYSYSGVSAPIGFVRDWSCGRGVSVLMSPPMK